MQILLILYLFGGLFLAGISLPLIAQKIKPNSLYGFRIQQTLNDPKTWYAVNRYAGKRLLATGLIYAGAAVLLYFVPGLSVDAYALLCLAVFVAVFTVAIVQSWRYMKTYKP